MCKTCFDLLIVIVRVALDTQPHPGATGSAMLGNLANMAAREVDASHAQQQIPKEFYSNGCPIGPLYRKLVDDYIWVTILLDTTTSRWPILHVNAAFHGMTGRFHRCKSKLLSRLSILAWSSGMKSNRAVPEILCYHYCRNQCCQL